jgi:hypothetical protein
MSTAHVVASSSFAAPRWPKGTIWKWALRRLAIYYSAAAVCAAGAFVYAAAHVGHPAPPPLRPPATLENTTTVPKTMLPPTGPTAPLQKHQSVPDQWLPSPPVAQAPQTTVPVKDLIELPGTALRVDEQQLHKTPVYFVTLDPGRRAEAIDLGLPKTIVGTVVGVGGTSTLKVRVHDREVTLPLNALSYHEDHGSLLSITVPPQVGSSVGIVEPRATAGFLKQLQQLFTPTPGIDKPARSVPAQDQ